MKRNKCVDGTFNGGWLTLHKSVVGKGDKRDSKGKGALSLDRCGWCDTEGASRTCSQCRSVVYCSPACQKVSRYVPGRLGIRVAVRDDQ